MICLEELCGRDAAKLHHATTLVPISQNETGDESSIQLYNKYTEIRCFDATLSCVREIANQLLACQCGHESKPQVIRVPRVLWRRATRNAGIR
jgi:hypothetical protein